jgi:hypothetical protein
LKGGAGVFLLLHWGTQISYDLIKNYLPELKEELIQMLDKVEYERELLENVVNTPEYGNLKYLLE